MSRIQVGDTVQFRGTVIAFSGDNDGFEPRARIGNHWIDLTDLEFIERPFNPKVGEVWQHVESKTGYFYLGNSWWVPYDSVQQRPLHKADSVRTDALSIATEPTNWERISS